ncbi:GatB/YqeY domain-containing protein [Aequorivita sp. H23M31]|uniref:GatB/YqeY domain-containing protein n=1 Tax=Aequorivita ciconiae TaxID=2494375 RepID=A0A410G2Y3_9FLAO|nr:GatB/YqeY domain-containing protein [Aequorivita sp. H23M31]QAA81591.1 GatB/YqeY domain-containing protein [Aequorivita sp. H23M31]
MSLQEKVMEAMKVAMKSKDTQSLEALRAVKSALLLAQTETGSKKELSEAEEMKLLQKQVKQRKDSAAIYQEQGRSDLAEPEMAQAKIIEQFLPQQMSEEDIIVIVDRIIAETEASGMADMGKVMGAVSTELAGKADGKTISTIVKSRLS